MGLQNVLGWWTTNCGNKGSQSVLGVGLQRWQNGLQSASGTTKCGGITK